MLYFRLMLLTINDVWINRSMDQIKKEEKTII